MPFYDIYMFYIYNFKTFQKSDIWLIYAEIHKYI